MKIPPSISIIIPTLNSERVLRECLDSIFTQDYPKDLLEILIIDAGSRDRTISIAEIFTEKYGPDVKILSNPLKTGEAGKAVGLKKAKNDVLAFIDSDNILPERSWLKKMVEPFNDRRIVATEPLEYTYRPLDGYINRYCALMGMNDPLCLFMGNYDRYCLLTDRWTESHIEVRDLTDYIEVLITNGSFPTIGANGFLIRRKILLSLNIGDYLFDVDIPAMLVENLGNIYIGKVRLGIIHLYCANLITFFRKQKRRILDYYRHNQKDRQPYPWDHRRKTGVLVFIISCVTVFPLLWQAIIGFSRKSDFSWFFHPIACWTTLLVYSYGTAMNIAGFRIEPSRNRWSQ